MILLEMSRGEEMSEKEFEPCTLEEATHVEVGGKVYEFGNGIVTKIKDGTYPRIRVINESVGNDYINESSFPIFGIKPMKEKKRKPRECMALSVIAQRNGKDVVALLPTADFELGMTVRCVEILEDGE